MEVLESPDEILRRNLESEMTKRGWRKADLARAAGLPISTIYPIWDGPVWPQSQTIAKLAGGLGLTVAELFAASPRPISAQEAMAVIARELDVRLARDPISERIAKLEPEGRQAIEALLEGLEDSPTPPKARKGLPEHKK